MNKKILSIIMAALLTVSISAVSAGAAEVEQEPSKASGTFFFDGGSGWENTSVCFYIWDDTTREFATKDGWVTDDTWGSKKKIGASQVEGKDTVYESYEFDLSGREDHEVFVIFHCVSSGEQTFQCIINDSVFGKTAYKSSFTLEAPSDSPHSPYGVNFEGTTGCGVPKTINSNGEIVGDVVSQKTKPAETVAKFVLDFLGKKHSASGEAVVTEENVANAITEFGTDKDSVWAEYLKFSGEENYNEAEAKKVIKPSEANPEPVISYVSSATSGSDSTSSKTSSTVSTTTTSGTSSTGTTGTTSGTSSTSSTGSSSSGSSSDTKSPKTGVVTNYAAMLAALFTSGAAVAFASKKRKEN